eukprot:jgi/Tetstr1/430830/TSEL_020613.t1
MDRDVEISSGADSNDAGIAPPPLAEPLAQGGGGISRRDAAVAVLREAERPMTASGLPDRCTDWPASAAACEIAKVALEQGMVVTSTTASQVTTSAAMSIGLKRGNAHRAFTCHNTVPVTDSLRPP